MRSRKGSYEMDMTSGPILPKVLLFSVPLMLSSVLQLLFNAADLVVVGRFAADGSSAQAAVGSTGALINLIINLFLGLSIGTNVAVARYYGAGRHKDASESVNTSITISFVGGLILAVFGFLFAETFLEWMGSPNDVRPLATVYVKIYFIGMPFNILYNFGSAVLRAVGDTRRPLIFLAIAGVTNVILNIFFVAGLGMDVDGVALATIISQAVSAALVTRSLMLMDGPTQLHLDRLAIKPHIMRMIIQIGLPAGIQSCMFSLSNVVIQSSVNSFGSIVIAGNAAGANVGNFVYQAMNTFQQAVTCFAGQNIGARKPRRVLSSMYVSLFWALSFGVVFGVLSCVFGTQLLGLYSPDPAVIQVGLNRMYIVCGPYFLCGIMDVMTGVLRGVGYSLLPMIVSLMGACVFRIFWVMTIFAANRTMDCLMISYPVSWALTFLVLVVIFAVLWKKKIRPRYTPEELAAR